MKYVIETIKTDLTNGNIVRSFSAPMYETPAAAHEVAREAGLVQFVKTEDGKRVRVCDYRVFPDTGDTDGIFDMARRMTRTACKLLIEKTGAGDVNTLNMLHALRNSTYAENVTDYNAQECISAAVCETWAAIVDGANLHEQAARALRAVYRHIRGERGYTNGRQARVLSLDGMDDKDVAYFNAIIDDVASNIADDETAHVGKDAPRLIDAVNERLTADQRKVMLLLSEGLTQAQIARVLDRNESTISRHVKLSRAALAAYMLETGAAIPDGVDVESVANMARYAADHRAEDTLRKGGTAARTVEAEKRAAERAAILDSARRAEQEAKKRADEARAAALARVAQDEAERAARLAMCASFSHVTRGEHVFAIIADEARAAANAAREEARRARLDVWQGQTAAAVARADKWRAVWQGRAENAYNVHVHNVRQAWADVPALVVSEQMKREHAARVLNLSIYQARQAAAEEALEAAEEALEAAERAAVARSDAGKIEAAADEVNKFAISLMKHGRQFMEAVENERRLRVLASRVEREAREGCTAERAAVEEAREALEAANALVSLFI